MKIEVTQEDINAGTRNDYFRCPIARAFTRALYAGVPGYIVVKRASVWIEEQRIPLPPIASRFIEDIDEGRPVQPFSFEIDL